MQTPSSPATRRPSHVGRSARLGGGSGRLLTASLLAGLLLAAAIGGLTLLLTQDQAEASTAFVVGTAIALPFTVALVWVLLVDRSSLAGAPADPESSIESRWYDKAASGAFHVLIASLGLGAGALALLDVDVAPSLVLSGYFVIAVVSFAVSYLLVKRAES